jgi:hypothetical protein
MTVKNFVFEIFLRLTSKTCPYGFEDELVKDVMFNILPDDIKKDQHGNYYYKIGNSRTIFTSHIDTVSKKYISVNHILDGNIIRTDGKTTLGADDKAGMTVMLWMIRNRVPGLYYFFIGEEVGCIGSGLASKYGNFKGNYDRVVSFDRRGTDSIITFQSSGRSCSESFANDLCEELNKFGMSYKKDDSGVYTDSAEFMDIIPECTNISVGYYKEHTVNEYQDIDHLAKLAKACVNVDWENLTTKRDPLFTEYKSYRNYWRDTMGLSYFDDDYDYNSLNKYNGKKQKRKRIRRNKSKDHQSGRVFYDNSGDLIEISNSKSNTKYTWIIHKYASAGLTSNDLQIVKENYLDMDIKGDIFFYEYLKEKIVDF